MKLIEKVELINVSFPHGLRRFESGRVITSFAICDVRVTDGSGATERRAIIVTRKRGEQAKRAGHM